MGLRPARGRAGRAAEERSGLYCTQKEERGRKTTRLGARSDVQNEMQGLHHRAERGSVGAARRRRCLSALSAAAAAAGGLEGALERGLCRQVLGRPLKQLLHRAQAPQRRLLLQQRLLLQGQAGRVCVVACSRSGGCIGCGARRSAPLTALLNLEGRRSRTSPKLLETRTWYGLPANKEATQKESSSGSSSLSCFGLATSAGTAASLSLTDRDTTERKRSDTSAASASACACVKKRGAAAEAA